jgi:hypothetical protein
MAVAGTWLTSFERELTPAKPHKAELPIRYKALVELLKIDSTLWRPLLKDAFRWNRAELRERINLRRLAFVAHSFPTQVRRERLKSALSTPDFTSSLSTLEIPDFSHLRSRALFEWRAALHSVSTRRSLPGLPFPRNGKQTFKMHSDFS